MGQTAQRLSAACSAVVLLGSVLSACGGGSGSSTRTVVRHPDSATIMDAAGHTRAAYDGEVLGPGEVVSTSAAGAASAVLDTGGRLVYLRPSSSWQVGDGAHAVLRSGAAVINGKHGPALHLRAADVFVRVPKNGVARVESGYATRIGVFNGSTSVSTSTGRALTVHALHQVVVVARALPSAADAPLVLTDDPAEAQVAPHLVSDDKGFNGLASEIDGGAYANLTSRVIVVTASFDRSVTSSGPRSPALLSLAIAESGKGSAQSRYNDAKSYRADGGSWAVVARLLGTDYARSSKKLNDLLTAPTTALAAGQSTGTATTSTPGSSASAPVPSITPSTSSGGGSTGPSQPPNPSTSPTPSHNPSPSPSKSTDLIGTVLGLLSPTPSPSGGGVLGGVGGLISPSPK